jgi:hypothetical protein
VQIAVKALREESAGRSIRRQAIRQKQHLAGGSDRGKTSGGIGWEELGSGGRWNAVYGI